MGGDGVRDPIGCVVLAKTNKTLGDNWAWAKVLKELSLEKALTGHKLCRLSHKTKEIINVEKFNSQSNVKHVIQDQSTLLFFFFFFFFFF